MTVDENTKLTDILAAWPWLPEELGRTEPRAKPFLALMRTPPGKGMLKRATVADAARFIDRPVGRLLTRLEEMIRAHESRQE